MPDLTRLQLVLAVLGLVAIAALGARHVAARSPGAATSPGAAAPASSGAAAPASSGATAPASSGAAAPASSGAAAPAPSGATAPAPSGATAPESASAAAAEPDASPVVIEDASAGGEQVTVHVAGAVRRPGVYRMPPTARVHDAVARAGGARPRADLSALNLAARVEDGRQVLVPRRGPAVAASPPSTAAGATTGSLGAPPPAPPVNLNTATLEQLDTLDGVGPVTAEKILRFRQERGGFGSVEELGEVSGIGPKRLAALRERVTL